MGAPRYVLTSVPLFRIAWRPRTWGGLNLTWRPPSQNMEESARPRQRLGPMVVLSFLYVAFYLGRLAFVVGIRVPNRRMFYRAPLHHRPPTYVDSLPVALFVQVFSTDAGQARYRTSPGRPVPPKSPLFLPNRASVSIFGDWVHIPSLTRRNF